MQGAILNVNGIITDLDRLQFTAWQKVAMYEYGMGLPGKLAADFKGLTKREALDKVLARFNANADEDERRELLAEQDRFYQEVLGELGEDDLVPGIKRLIIALYDHYVKLAINGDEQHATTIAQQLKLTEFVDITGTDDQDQPYTSLANQLDVPTSGCIALVTTPEELQAANRAGMVTIGIGDTPALAAADYQVHQVGDLRYQMLEKVWEDTHESK